MTINYFEGFSQCSSHSGKDADKNIASTVALKRYLNLSLRGTRKNFTEPDIKGKGKHPLSPYTFDQPEMEKSVQKILQNPNRIEDVTRPPNWVKEINSIMITNNGEAPIFTQNFLPLNKDEQKSKSKYTGSRPQSGISTKSAPVIINGAMYYRQHKKHDYLQASIRPSSALESRMTRGAKLRNKHKLQSMSGVPSDGTKDELQRLKSVKPRRQNLNKDLMPIPCHTNETSHSFIIGARYNCSNFMDSRSFSWLGLYVPRKNPIGSFLKSYKKDQSSGDSRIDSGGNGDLTSVCIGNSTNLVSSLQSEDRDGAKDHHNSRRIPTLHRRRLVKESWLAGSEKNIGVEKKRIQHSQSISGSGLMEKLPKHTPGKQHFDLDRNASKEIYHRSEKKSRMLKDLHLMHKKSMNDISYVLPLRVADVE